MIRGKMENGFEFEVDENKLDDMEFIDALAEMEANPLAFPRVCLMLLGREQRAKLYDVLRVDGRVSISDMSDAIDEIFQIMESSVKNS